MPYPLFEFQFDTIRAVANMIFSGTLKRNPGIKFVYPHMGALFPLLSGHMEGIAKLMVLRKTAPEGFVPPDVHGELNDLYYDGAGGFNLPSRSRLSSGSVGPKGCSAGATTRSLPPPLPVRCWITFEIRICSRRRRKWACFAATPSLYSRGLHRGESEPRKGNPCWRSRMRI